MQAAPWRDFNLKYELARKEQETAFLQRTRVLQDAYNCSPVEFETLVKLLFERVGYQVQTTPHTGDDGIDLVLQKDNQTELVQCKRFKNNVSVQVIREFYGVMVDCRCAKGYVVTTGHFTAPARDFAAGKGIHLIDGPELADMLVKFDVPDDKLIRRKKEQ